MVMDCEVFEQFRRESISNFEGATFAVKDHTDATFYIHDKWGRAESFLLFD